MVICILKEFILGCFYMKNDCSIFKIYIYLLKIGINVKLSDNILRIFIWLFFVKFYILVEVSYYSRAVKSTGFELNRV